MQNTNSLNSLPTKENSPKLSFSVLETENENGIQIHKESSPKKSNICEYCHKPFSTLGNMRNHIMTIHQNYRPFKCTYPGCNKKYSIESRFQVHMRTHIGAKPFVCQICSKSFNEKGNLKTHLRFHSELRPFKCPHCTKSYKTNGHLKDHIEIQHNLIKKYECQYCNKKFGRISTLKAHIRTHTGEKNFKCKMEGCQKWFAEKGNMEIHYRRHLKKLNKIDEYEKINKKKYGEKNIEKDYEERIKEAIDNLKDINSNNIKDCKKIELKHINLKKGNKVTNPKPIFLKNNLNIINNEDNDSNIKSNILKDQISCKNNVNNGYIFNSNLNNINILSQGNDKLNNNFRLINENNYPNNFNNHMNNVNNALKNLSNLNNLNNYSNTENFVNIDKDNQNFFGYFPIYPLIQDIHQIDPLIGQENKMDINKEINDISNCLTRPCSNTALCLQKKYDDIFAKEEDILSEEEELSKNNNCKNINDNSYINENINMHYNQNNYNFLDNQLGFLNEDRMNNLYNNFNEMSEVKNLPRFQYI